MPEHIKGFPRLSPTDSNPSGQKLFQKPHSYEALYGYILVTISVALCQSGFLLVLSQEETFHLPLGVISQLRSLNLDSQPVSVSVHSVCNCSGRPK